MKYTTTAELTSVFWGKFCLEKKEWHPLTDHCADVAACFNVLLTSTILKQRFSHLAGFKFINDVQIQRLSFLAALHDVGKFNHGFQTQILEGNKSKGHVGPVLLVLNDENLRKDFLDAIRLSSILPWFSRSDCTLQYLLATISHHGRPVTMVRGSAGKLWSRDEEKDPIEGIRTLVARAMSWFPLAFNTRKGEHLLPDKPIFQHIFCGLVTLADWLGSDTRFFPYSEESDPDRWEFACIQASNAMRELYINPMNQRTYFRDHEPSFKKVFGYEAPLPTQSVMHEFPLSRTESITLLEAETGSGKTEAAVQYYLRLFREGLVDGMYFALPTRCAAVQIHKRITAAIKAAFREAAPPVVLAVPGYIKIDAITGTKDALAPFTVLWPDEQRERYRFRGWAAEHPKRYLAGTIVVGTVDQVLLATLQVSHAHLRASSLLRHLLIIDEIHASDPYMSLLLEKILKLHLLTGGHALLMSATLGSIARERIFHNSSAILSSYKEEVTRPYPSIEVRDNSGSRIVKELENVGEGKKVRVELLPLSNKFSALSHLAIGYALMEARVLILRNTVGDAIRTQITIESLSSGDEVLFRCRGICSLHHGRFTSEDRKILDEALEQQLGKEASTGRKLVVTTQTAEQSLDIDADLLITDLCPMDVLLQRVGRLHRHKQKSRPMGFYEPRLIVLTPEKRDLQHYIITGGRERGRARGPHGIGTVYADLRILEATWELLEKTDLLDLPAMNRDLVEGTTHPDVLKRIVSCLGDVWEHHDRRMEGIRIGRRGIAGMNSVNWNEPFDSMDCQFAGVDDEIATRLGEKDRIIHFHSPVKSPFGVILQSMTVPSWMARGMDEELIAEEVEVIDGGFRFILGTEIFLYDRFGLRRDDEQSAT